jgi:hypothetical protein
MVASLKLGFTMKVCQWIVIWERSLLDFGALKGKIWLCFCIKTHH